MSIKRPLYFCLAAFLGLSAAQWLLSEASVPVSTSTDSNVPEVSKTAEKKIVRQRLSSNRQVPSASSTFEHRQVLLLDLLEEEALQALENSGSGMGVLWVEVVDEDGRQAQDVHLMVQGCRAGLGEAQDPAAVNFFNLGNRPFHAAMPVGECLIRASRLDGILSVESPVHSVEIVDGEISSAVLTLPGEKGGLGILLGVAEEGILVGGIFEGSPAWDSPLEVGDVILSVDGQSTEEMSREDFAELGTGRPGSSVSLLVMRDADDLGAVYQSFSLSREYLAEDLELSDPPVIRSDF